jgi:hypothetical protein
MTHAIFGIWELVCGDAVHTELIPFFIEAGGLQGAVDSLGGLLDST